MKSTLRLYLIGLSLLVLGCKLDDLPREKRLKECVKPAGTITATVDPTNYLKYTFTLTTLTGDVDNVVWTVNGVPSQPIPKNQAYSYPFPQAGNFNVSVSLQNSCANNATLQSSVSVTPFPPAVSTGAVISAGSASATVQLTVTSLGSSASLTEYGVVYAEAPNNNPTLENAFSKPLPGTPSLNLPAPVTITTNLKPNTRYFYKAYVRYGAGQVEYGTTVAEFTTKAAVSGVKLYGGSSFDFGYFMVPTADGGGVIAGNSNSNDGDLTGNKGGYDALVGRYDGNRVFYWRKSLGGSGTDNLRCLQFTADGYLIAVGTTNSSDGDLNGKNKGGNDVWVVKLNSSSGEVIWLKTYGGSKDDLGFSIQATNDNGCVFAGTTSSDDGDINASTGRKGDADIWVVKLNSSGGIEWQKAYGGSGEDVGKSIQTTRDGGYIVAGSTKSSNVQVTNFKGITDGWVFKVNFLGALQWQKTLGDGGNDEASCVQQTLDNGFVVTGFIATPGTGKRDIMVSKLTSGGDLEAGFPKSFGGSNEDEGTYIEQNQDGSYILVANTNSSDVAGLAYRGGANDIWVMKLKADGKTIDWQKPVGGSGDDQSYCIRAVSDGYWLIGFTGSINQDGAGNKGSTDIFVVKMDLNGIY